MLVCANKVDLEAARCVGTGAGRELARALHAPYIETSAKEPPLRVDAAFHEVLSQLILHTKEEDKKIGQVRIRLVGLTHYEGFRAIYKNAKIN